MKKTNLWDLYFYKGKYRTDEGLKRALIKDGIVWVSPKKNYYLYEHVFEYSYDYDALKDYVTGYELCTEEEAKHFRKWLNQKIRDGKIEVNNTSWYHCEANDGIGEPDWRDARDAVMSCMDVFDPKCPDDFIENAEYSVEEYVQTITDEEWEKFQKLPEEKQYKLAMRWRINLYNKCKESSK